MDNVITTSYVDEKYYVINNADSKLFYLVTILLDKKYDVYANYLMEYQFIKKDLKNEDSKLFIEKDSDFGKILDKTISLRIIDDEKNMIRKETLVNALINAVCNGEKSDYFSNIESFIKNNITGRIEDLSKSYDLSILNRISKEARNQFYLSSLSLPFDGCDDHGLLLKDGEFFRFDVITKKILPLEEKDNKKRVKKNN